MTWFISSSPKVRTDTPVTLERRFSNRKRQADGVPGKHNVSLFWNRRAPRLFSLLLFFLSAALTTLERGR